MSLPPNNVIKIKFILGHKASLGKFKKIEIIPSILSAFLNPISPQREKKEKRKVLSV